MSRICQICEKSYLKGNLVPRLIGRRVSKRTTKTQQPNLRAKRVLIDGQVVKVRICASCLKRIKLEKSKHVYTHAHAHEHVQ